MYKVGGVRASKWGVHRSITYKNKRANLLTRILDLIPISQNNKYIKY